MGQRSLIEDAPMRNVKSHRTNYSTGALTLTAAYVLSDDEPDLMSMNPGGASRNVTLPAVANQEGRVLRIANAATALEDLVVKNAGAVTIATISQNEIGTFFCCAGLWYGATGLQT